MKKCLIRLVLLLVLLIHFSFSQSLPTGHWVYNSIRKMQLMGVLCELPQGGKPYSRIEIAHELHKFIESDSTVMALHHPEYSLLLEEFNLEIRQLESNRINKSSEHLYSYIKVSSQSTMRSHHQTAMSFRMSYSIFPKLSMQYGAVLDQGLKSDSSFVGYEWRGFTGYQDQLFIQFSGTYVTTKFGRDYLRWGYGHTGSLFITDNSRPFDMLNFRINGKMIRFESFVAQLDKMYAANRYLTATRMEIKPRSSVLIGLGQSALYGGINRPLDFTLSNPLAFYSFTQDNDQKYMNMMLYADWAVSLTGYRIYGEFLIDDFQIDREKQSDLEPNEIAFLIGLDGVQVCGIFDFWIEYTQIRNRTYNVPEIRPWEKFLHRGKPIAHPEGNDFHLLAGRGEVWINQALQGYTNVSMLKKGEGTITGTFTEPWMDAGISLETGYYEKFPTGIIESTFTFDLGLVWRPSSSFYIDIMIGYVEVLNDSHVTSVNSSEMNTMLKLSTKFDRLFSSP